MKMAWGNSFAKNPPSPYSAPRFMETMTHVNKSGRSIPPSSYVEVTQQPFARTIRKERTSEIQPIGPWASCPLPQGLPSLPFRISNSVEEASSSQNPHINAPELKSQNTPRP
jgi:hypothetical protein